MTYSKFKYCAMAVGLALVSTLIQSCGDSAAEPDYPDRLYVEESGLEFGAEGGYQTFLIVSENVAWKIDRIPEWVSVSPTQGATNAVPRVTVEPNPLSTERRDSFFVVSAQSNYPVQYCVKLTQKGR